MTHPSPRTLRKLYFILVAAVSLLPMLPASLARAGDNPFDQFPVVITCKSKDTYHAFYLSRIDGHGVATYVASERIAGTITLDGDAVAVGGEGGGSCVGKTLAMLRSAGQAHDLSPKRP